MKPRLLYIITIFISLSLLITGCSNTQDTGKDKYQFIKEHEDYFTNSIANSICKYNGLFREFPDDWEELVRMDSAGLLMSDGFYKLRDSGVHVNLISTKDSVYVYWFGWDNDDDKINKTIDIKSVQSYNQVKGFNGDILLLGLSKKRCLEINGKGEDYRSFIFTKVNNSYSANGWYYAPIYEVTGDILFKYHIVPTRQGLDKRGKDIHLSKGYALLFRGKKIDGRYSVSLTNYYNSTTYENQRKFFEEEINKKGIAVDEFNFPYPYMVQNPEPSDVLNDINFLNELKISVLKYEPRYIEKSGGFNYPSNMHYVILKQAEQMDSLETLRYSALAIVKMHRYYLQNDSKDILWDKGMINTGLWFFMMRTGLYDVNKPEEKITTTELYNWILTQPSLVEFSLIQKEIEAINKLSK